MAYDNTVISSLLLCQQLAIDRHSIRWRGRRGGGSTKGVTDGVWRTIDKCTTDIRKRHSY